MPASSPSMIFASESPLAHVARAASRVARSDATVLLTGETGTGKEVFARHVHNESARAGKAMVAVNCAAIPEALLESELFGHVRGAFTGAVGARKGRVALAEGGTLFLDEIGEMPLALQVKLLRLLQERTYEPVGSAESVTANFRLVVATHRDLEKEVAAGRFRQDLYFRLNVCPLELPPLRERPCDVRALFTHFWETRGETRPVEPAAMSALMAYRWPGNVRELENLAERLSVCAPGETIRLADLPATMRSPAQEALEQGLDERAHLAQVFSLTQPVTAAPAASTPTATSSEQPSNVVPLPVPFPAIPEVPEGRLPVDLPRILRELEDAYINAALERSGGSRKIAAEMLGLQRTTLVEKLRRRKAASPSPVNDLESVASA